MFTKGFMAGGDFQWGKLTPENASQEYCPPEICPHPPKKKKEKKRKLTPENMIS